MNNSINLLNKDKEDIFKYNEKKEKMIFSSVSLKGYNK